MTKQYLLTYGSLLSRDSRVRFSSIEGDVLPVTIAEWKRSWCVRHHEERATHAGALRVEGSSMSGALLPTVVTPALRKRETCYEFVQIDSDYLTALEPEASLPADAIFWICEPIRADDANEDFPLSQSYVDTCLIGCIEHGLPAWGQRFVSETGGWEHYWIDDRGGDLLFPRAAILDADDRAAVDALLEQGGVLSNRLAQ